MQSSSQFCVDELKKDFSDTSEEVLTQWEGDYNKAKNLHEQREITASNAILFPLLEQMKKQQDQHTLFEGAIEMIIG